MTLMIVILLMCAATRAKESKKKENNTHTENWMKTQITKGIIIFSLIASHSIIFLLIFPLLYSLRWVDIVANVQELCLFVHRSEFFETH